MYIGAGLALTGAALFYQSIPLLGYAGVFLLITHAFVMVYKEPALRRAFDGDYEAYPGESVGGGRNCERHAATRGTLRPDPRSNQ